jgi:phage/plasmid-associated DNA primase
MDPVAGFFEEHCVFDAGGTFDTSALRQAYEDWCRHQGIRFPLSGKDFAQRLQAPPRNCTPGKSNGKRLWRGIRKLEHYEDSPPRTPGAAGHGFPQSPLEKIHSTNLGETTALLSQPSLFEQEGDFDD